MKNIKKLQIIIVSILIGNSLNAMYLRNPSQKIDVYMGGTNGRYSNFRSLEAQELYSIELNNSVCRFRKLFKEFEDKMPIDQAFKLFMDLGCRGKAMFVAHEIVLNEILSSEEVVAYINRKKGLLNRIVERLRAEGFNSGMILYRLKHEEIDGFKANFGLNSRALDMFLEENFEDINPIGPKDDADLADGLAPSPQDFD